VDREIVRMPLPAERPELILRTVAEHEIVERRILGRDERVHLVAGELRRERAVALSAAATATSIGQAALTYRLRVRAAGCGHGRANGGAHLLE
jgi:hypothetical protein